MRPGDLLPLPRWPVVLLYHRVAVVPAAEDPGGLAVSPASFERQLGLLRRRGYASVALGGDAPRAAAPRTVAITFDDGYLDNYTTGLPLLLAHGFTATIFLATGFVGSTASWRGGSGAPMMGWSEAAEMARQGLALQSHTRTHPDLTACDDATLDRELGGSRQELEDRLGREVRCLAYPYGRLDDRVVGRAARAGYASGFAAGLSVDGPLTRERLQVGAGDGRATFTLKASGWASWARRVLHGGRLPSGARSRDGA